MKLISIILPVYNVQDYLKKCIESIINQTYQNFELLIINDGSTDQSLNICQSFKDERITIISQVNSGLSSARNTGIRYAKGDYICFVDSDDYVSTRYLETMVNALKNTGSLMCFSRFSKTTDDNCEFSNKHKYFILSKEKALETMFYQNKYDTNSWGKLYKKELFENIEFPVGKYFEDLFTTYKLIEKCDTITFCRDVTYAYRIRKGSIMNSSNKHIFDYIEINNILLEHYSKESKKLKKSVIVRCFKNYISLLRKTTCPENEKYLKEFLSYTKENKFNILLSKTTLTVKIFCVLSIILKSKIRIFL